MVAVSARKSSTRNGISGDGTGQSFGSRSAVGPSSWAGTSAAGSVSGVQYRSGNTTRPSSSTLTNRVSVAGS